MLFESSISGKRAGITEEQRAFIWTMLQLNMARSDRTAPMKAMSVSNALGWDWDEVKMDGLISTLAQFGMLYNVLGEGTSLRFQIANLVSC